MIDEVQAIAIAQRVAAQHDWAWRDPALATLRRTWTGGGGRWEVLSNAHALGAKVRVLIDATNGDVLEQGYLTR